MKIKSIKLSDGHSPANPSQHKSEAAWSAATRYRVEQIVNSVEYRTGQLLEHDVVEALCQLNGWQVTIVPVKR